MSYNKSNPNGSATSANSSPVVIASDQAAVPVSGTFFQSTQPVSAASLPLPTGAATAAKQPALGTAGTPSTDVLTIQGITSMVALKVDGSAVTQPVSAASLPLPTGAATSALQTTGNTSVASIDTKTPALGQALAAASVPVVLTAAQVTTLTPPTTVTANAGTNLNTSALALETGGNLATIATRTPALGQALAAASVPVILPSATITTLTPPAAITGFALDATLTGGTQRTKITDGTNNAAVKAASTAAIATDPAVVVAISPNNTVPVSLATNTPVIAAGTNLIGKVGIDQTTVGTTNAVSLAQIGANTVLTGNGTAGTGAQRVTIASDNTPFTVNSQTVPTTTGGLSTFHLAAAASTNATNIKASAGQLYGYMISNTSAAYSYVAFHNSASAPTAGASIFFKIGIPAGGAANVEFSNGVAFSSGIGITTVTGAPDSNSTAVALSDLVINIFYK